MASILERALADQSIADTLALKLDADKALGGEGQSWQDKTSERNAGVTYTNSKNSPIFIYYRITQNTSITVTNGGETFNGPNTVNGAGGAASFIVLPNDEYSFEFTDGGSITVWLELR